MSSPPVPAMRQQSEEATSVHASCVLLDDRGLLILGDSGAGKTTLALGLLDRWRRAGRFARMVADDRTMLWTSGRRVLGRSHPRIAGDYELFGYGIQETTYERAAVIRAAVWCQSDDGPRYPDDAAPQWRHGAMSLPMISLGKNHQRELLVMAFLDHSGAKEAMEQRRGPSVF
ncbi:hypothetical protein GCM10019059_12170 [Camelimonas fluminis]|uniref:HPr kinase/phosphorylase n=1 Tax=Camelimonas fluminis TaxID=1576911 RepID=A0ABV7UM26_9HYPH|nr:serine kinase [Camelimonas fluminis]GHE54454.1 hypothetical protein GCM10019059_12170 [Camelimonas fluminis]